MSAVRVYDPARCCSTGLCGPGVDPQLVRFAADLDWLQGEGVAVERFKLEERGETALPLILVDGAVKSAASGCVLCLSVHEQRARSLGVSVADVRRALETGQLVRETSAVRVDQHAACLLDKRRTSLPLGESPVLACCTPSGAAGSGGASGSTGSSCC